MSGCLGYGLLVVAALLAEVASIFIVGSYVGALWTIVALAAGIALGLALLAGRGLMTITGAIAAHSDRKSVAPVVVQGAITAFAGVLLVFPGFASDIVGLLLMIPQVRAGVRDQLVARFEAKLAPLPGGIDGPRAGGGAFIDTTATEVPEVPEFSERLAAGSEGPDGPAGPAGIDGRDGDESGSPRTGRTPS